MNSRESLPIGVFDSGLGGLTVVKQLKVFLPNENVIYVGDTARVPYGTKSPETIRRYALQIAFYLIQRKVKALVVACNSVSAVAMSALKDLPIPVVGVIEPGARAAVMTTNRMKVGVIGTNATIASHAYSRAIKKYAPRAQVWETACPLFVPLVEEGWTDHDVTRQVAREYLKPLLKNKPDTLVLGCTHYPLLKSALQSIAGPGVRLIDSAEETAKEVKALLEKNHLRNPSKKPSRDQYFVTDTPRAFSRLSRSFMGQAISPAQRLTLDSF